MELLYDTLLKEGLFEPGATDDLAPRARALLETRSSRLFGDLGSRLARRVPVLADHLRESWTRAIRSFVLADLREIARHGQDVASLEQRRSVVLDFGREIRAEVVGRFDRCLTGADGITVSDYKTSGNLDRRVDVTRMLRAEALQVPLYRKMAGPGARVELLGVGPAFDYDGDAHVASFEGFDDSTGPGFDETMRVLLALLRSGSFPLKAGDHCNWCPYDRACRHSHPPTLDREAWAEDTEAFRRLGKKTRKKPMLADGKEPS